MTILEIEGQKVEIDDSFLDLSPEEQNATVEEIAASLGVSSASSGGQNGLIGQLNAGIANSLGAPVDLVAAGLSKIGIDTGDTPFGGSQSIRRGMEAINAPPATEDPDSLAEQFSRGGGEAAGTLLPVTGVARALQAGSGIAAGAGATISQPFASAPVRATAAEMAAGGGARLGGELAAQTTESDSALVRAGGEIAGGLAAAAGPGAAARTAGAMARRAPVVGTGIKVAQKAIAPFTEAGGLARASDRVRSLAADPETAAKAIEGENLGGLTPAQQTGDPKLLALEKAVAEQNPVVRERLDEIADQSGETLRSELEAPAQGQKPDVTQDFLERRRAAFEERMIGRLDVAREAAEERIAAVSPQRRETENSLIVREEIEKAYQSAKSQESVLWGAVPREVIVPTGRLRATFEGIVEDTPRAQASDIPADARQLIEGDGGFGEAESVKEMHGLYSRLRQVAREAVSGAAPQENRARIANMLADSILEDIGAVSAPKTEAGIALNEARAFSRAMNEAFSQGTVGRIIGRLRNGGDAVAPEAALAGTVGRQGAPAAVAVDELRMATAGDMADEAIQDFLKGRFTDRAMPRGDFLPDRAQDFQRNNREALDRFPELAADIDAAQEAGRDLSKVEARVSDIVKRINNPRESVGAAFIKAQNGDEVAAAVFKAKNPVKAAAEITRQARRDDTGRALDGLKGGFLDYLIKGAERSYSSSGQRELSGNALFGQLKDEKTREAFERVFSKSEMARLDDVAGRFQKLEAARKAKTLDAAIDDLPNAVISFLARSFAARQGARAGAGTSGASMLTAGFASKRMQTILENLTNDRADALLRDAITDPELFRTLLAPLDSPRNSGKAVERRLTEWLAGYGGVVSADGAAAENDESGSQKTP